VKRVATHHPDMMPLHLLITVITTSSTSAQTQIGVVRNFRCSPLARGIEQRGGRSPADATRSRRSFITRWAEAKYSAPASAQPRPPRSPPAREFDTLPSPPHRLSPESTRFFSRGTKGARGLTRGWYGDGAVYRGQSRQTGHGGQRDAGRRRRWPRQHRRRADTRAGVLWPSAAAVPLPRWVAAAGRCRPRTSLASVGSSLGRVCEKLSY